MSVFWGLFKTEIGLVLLCLGVLVYDIFLKDDPAHGRRMAGFAMAGVAILFAVLVLNAGQWGTSFGRSYVQDGLAVVFKGIFLVAGFFTLFMVRSFQERLSRGHEEFTLLVLLSLTGMVVVASANDFLLLFIALETVSIPLYILTAFQRERTASVEAGLKYVILGALSTAFFLFGLSFIYGAAGSTSYGAIQRSLAADASLHPAFGFGMLFIIAALGFKIAAFPFQMWVPDIYEGAPSPVTAFLAIGSKAAGFAALVRLLTGVFFPVGAELAALFAVLAALTMLYGNLGAIPQTNIKRLLGYSSIGHAGYILMGLAAFSRTGHEAVLYYLMTYLFSTGGAFLVVIAVSRHFKTEEIQEYAGLARRSPALAAGMLVALVSLAGVPPLAGFFGKFYLIGAAVGSGLLWLALIGLLNVIPSLYFYLKIVNVMYVDPPKDGSVWTLAWPERAMQLFSVAGILVLGIWQGPFVRLAEWAFAQPFLR